MFVRLLIRQPDLFIRDDKTRPSAATTVRLVSLVEPFDITCMGGERTYSSFIHSFIQNRISNVRDHPLVHLTWSSTPRPRVTNENTVISPIIVNCSTQLRRDAQLDGGSRHTKFSPPPSDTDDVIV